MLGECVLPQSNCSQSALSCKAGKTIQWETARPELAAMEKSPGGVHNYHVPQECPGMVLGAGKTVPEGTGKIML